ncbi:hypothetical protein D1007_15915 [Hordeum vulgare]|nr:hypothetical protein D1007_15915 [Hordeum vulgare]
MYLLQSTLVLMGKETETPHLPGMLAALPMLMPLNDPARFFRQRHAACRSAAVDALPFRVFTPPQHPADGAVACPVAYDMHGAIADVTSPQVTAADAISATASAASTANTAISATRAIEDLVLRPACWKP